MRGGPADLGKLLSGDAWPRVVVLTGEDFDARDRALRAIVQRVPEDDRATAVERFSDGPLARVLDAARTAPLLGGRRVVIVVQCGWLAPGADESEQEVLARYVRRPADHAVLVLDAPKVDRRLAVSKAVEECGLLVECPSPRERDMPGWLAERGRARGLQLDPDAALALADAVGADTSLAARELEKLSLLAGTEVRSGMRRVGVELVEQALGPVRAAGAFALEDALLAGRSDQALETLRRRLAGADPGAPLALLGRIAAIVRRLATANGVVQQGGGEPDVQRALGAHPFVARKYTVAARRVGGRAGRALAACVAADGMLKSGRDGHAALAEVVLALTAPRER